MPGASPTSVIPDRKNEYYRSDEELLHAIADAMRAEYRAIVDAGLAPPLEPGRPPGTLPPHGAPPRPPPRRHLRPHGAARELRRLPQLGGDERRGDQPRAHRYSRGAGALPRLLGKLAWPARDRRAAQGHRRPGAQDQGADLSHRGREPPPRARMARVGEREAARGQGARSGVDQPRHQRGGASRARGAAHPETGEARRPRPGRGEHRLRLRAGPVPPPRSPPDPVGETRGAGRGRPARFERAFLARNSNSISGSRPAPPLSHSL